MYREFRILVAEDNSGDVFLLERAFTRAGINAPLQFVPDGQGAVDYLAGHGGYADRQKFPVPKLVIVDLKMPGLDGFGVIEWIRKQPGLGLLPVLVLSSSDEQADIDRAHALGANGYSVKEVDFERFIDVVKGIEGFWLRQHKYPTISVTA